MKSFPFSDECHAAPAAVETGASANGRSDSTSAGLFVGLYSKLPELHSHVPEQQSLPEFHSDVVEQQSLPMGHRLRDSFSYPFGLIRKHPVQESFRSYFFCHLKRDANLQLEILNFLIQDSQNLNHRMI